MYSFYHFGGWTFGKGRNGKIIGTDLLDKRNSYVIYESYKWTYHNIQNILMNGNSLKSRRTRISYVNQWVQTYNNNSNGKRKKKIEV